MTDALSIALSGLMAQSRTLSATASNIANATTTGALPPGRSAPDINSGAGTAPGQSPASTVYKPLNVSYTTLSDGGVIANVTQDQNGYAPVYDPSNAYANSQGIVAAPNVDFAQQIVNLIETKEVYKANVDVIKTQDEMTSDLLNTIA